MFPIKKIEIEGNKAIDNNEIIKDLDFLKNSSLLFVNKQNIEDILLKNKFVSKIILKKIYPNILRLIIFEKEPVAVQIIEKNKYYITKKNENINFYELEIYKELPVIFGNQKDFDIFYEILEKTNFDIYNIKAFYYFDVGRWDIMLMDERIIKLPEKNYQNILEELNSILKDIDDLVLDSEGDVAKTMKESRYIVESVSRNIDAINQNMDGAARNLYEFSRQIRQNPGLLLGGTSPEDKGSVK